MVVYSPFCDSLITASFMHLIKNPIQYNQWDCLRRVSKNPLILGYMILFVISNNNSNNSNICNL